MMTMKPVKFLYLILSLSLLSCASELKLGSSDAPQGALNRSSDLLPYVQVLTDAPILNEPKNQLDGSENLTNVNT